MWPWTYEEKLMVWRRVWMRVREEHRRGGHRMSFGGDLLLPAVCYEDRYPRLRRPTKVMAGSPGSCRVTQFLCAWSRFLCAKQLKCTAVSGKGAVRCADRPADAGDVGTGAGDRDAAWWTIPTTDRVGCSNPRIGSGFRGSILATLAALARPHLSLPTTGEGAILGPTTRPNPGNLG
jgi:hypothetical protein